MRAYRRAPLVGRWSVASGRAAWWTWRSLRRAERDLKRDGVHATVTPPPSLPAGARRGVEFVLRRTSPTCLERCLVLQTWLAAQHVPCEIVVGVARDADRVRAHAWLDVERHDAVALGYSELHRLPPP
ncbi:lasso peptide biosynthesis B2 protein [Nocardioides flavescens]|uniref:lasso peptide biosynthesis B2 protein n=1 Tax=Nocardioides flavescens TaxID=2691959 RepID=UPI0034E0DD9C